MSLKSYDLLWVVGKSAAWRYPGEISELKSFAPAVPEQAADLFRRRPASENPGPDPEPTKKTETVNTKTGEGNPPRRDPARSIYVNLPAEKKQPTLTASPPLRESLFPSAERTEPIYDFSDLYKKHSSRTIRFSGKLLWIGAIILLFGTGILTGFFISDRRKFFSGDANRPQNVPAIRPAVRNEKKEIPAVLSKDGQSNQLQNNISIVSDTMNKIEPATKKLIAGDRKKNSKNNHDKKDSINNQEKLVSSYIPNDSPRQNTITQTELLNQKIKSHPENYVELVTGRYSKGIFGGISSFPVTVTNKSPVKMDLVVVNVDYIQNNEKIFRTESITFNDLEPGETVTIKAPKSPRGVKIATRLHVISSRQIDLSYSN